MQSSGRGRGSHSHRHCVTYLALRDLEWHPHCFHPAGSLVSEHGRVLSLEIVAVGVQFFWSTTRDIEALPQDFRKYLRNSGLRGGLLGTECSCRISSWMVFDSAIRGFILTFLFQVHRFRFWLKIHHFCLLHSYALGPKDTIF